MSTWLIYALLSALSASLVAIFGKIGLQHLDANTATAVRAVVMALFLVGVVVVQGKFNLVGTVLADKKALLFIVLSGVAGLYPGCSTLWPLKMARFRKWLPLINSVWCLPCSWRLFCLAKKSH